MSDYVVLSGVLLGFAAILFVLNRMAASKTRRIKFSTRVFSALGFGVLFGLILQTTGISENYALAVSRAFEWIGLVGDGYVRLLRMVVMPLIIVSISGAILKMSAEENLQKITTQIIGVLVGTTAIAAIIGIILAKGFNLTPPDVTAAGINRGEVIESLAASNNLSIPNQLLQMIPVNPFQDMTGARPSSTIAVVIFMAFFAIAARQIAKKKETSYNRIKEAVEAMHDVVMRILTMVLRLTPYGVSALIARMVATSPWADIVKLLTFVGASYLGLLMIMMVHFILLIFSGLNPITYLKKSWTTLTFAFTSRTSAGTIPLNIKTQKEALGVGDSAADLSATLGSSIGQNGCAGLYPAMVAVMIMADTGMEMNIASLAKLVVIVAIASFGVAGVGGGATFAALIVLGLMDLPVALVGLLIAIEPLIDMGRTAINVSGAMLSGVLSSRWQGTLDTKVYNDPKALMTADE